MDLSFAWVEYWRFGCVYVSWSFAVWGLIGGGVEAEYYAIGRECMYCCCVFFLGGGYGSRKLCVGLVCGFAV